MMPANERAELKWATGSGEKYKRLTDALYGQIKAWLEIELALSFFNIMLVRPLD